MAQRLADENKAEAEPAEAGSNLYGDEDIAPEDGAGEPSLSDIAGGEA